MCTPQIYFPDSCRRKPEYLGNPVELVRKQSTNNKLEEPTIPWKILFHITIKICVMHRSVTHLSYSSTVTISASSGCKSFGLDYMLYPICLSVYFLIYMLCTSWDFVQVATCTTLLYKLQLVRPASTCTSLFVQVATCTNFEPVQVATCTKLPF